MKLLDIHLFSEFRGYRDVKVLRHKAKKVDLWAMRRDGTFDRYQNRHGHDVLKGANYIISFIAERQRFGKFVGVWEVHSKSTTRRGGVRYRTTELDGFSSLTERLVVDWGGGARSWVQWLHRAGNKQVSEILPANYVADFPGYYDFVLPRSELVRIIKHPEANREWHRMLSAVTGVYLILDSKTGKQYVGSAYGKGGIWGRWRSYANNPAGGNKLLRDLIGSNPKRAEHFQFSILRVLEPGIPKEAVTQHEVMAKQKLGSRAFGLNAN